MNSRSHLDILFRAAVEEEAEKLVERDRKIALQALERIQAAAEAAILQLKGEKPVRVARHAKPVTPTTTEPMVPVSVAPSNGAGPFTVLQKVHRYIADQGTAQDAKTVVAGTGIPEPSVRWAFAQLTEKGSLKRESRGRYVIASPLPEGVRTDSEF
jgi:hypothetical protein